MGWLQSFILLLGRICIAALFLYSAYETALHWDSSVQAYQSREAVQPQLLLLGITLIQLFGGISLLLGWKIRIGAFLLLLAFGTKMVLFNDFWSVYGSDPTAFQDRFTQFLQNLAIFGALLYVLSCGAGGLSFDQVGSQKKQRDLEE